jgi:hypothetical protein
MKKSDIIEIAIRILGLYLFVNWLPNAVEFLAITFLPFLQVESFSDRNVMLVYMGIAIGNIVLMISIAFFLLFGAKKIVRRVCNPEDFEETYNFNTEPKAIYQMALIITGLILISWTLAEVSWHIKYYLNLERLNVENNEAEFRRMWISITKIFIGIFLIQLSGSISDYFGKNKRNENSGT